MLRWQTWTGVILGLVLGLVWLALLGAGRVNKAPPGGPILSECDGHFRELVIHYEPSAREIVARVYREFLGALEGDVTVHVVCPSRAAYQELVGIAGQARCALHPIIVQHPMTTWSRDRWVAMSLVAGGPTTLWSPRGEAAGEIWPARTGDEQVGQDIANALAPVVRARRSPFYFDGGDFLADSDNVFVVPRVLPRNIQRTVRNQDEFLNVLAAELKRPVVLLKEAPDHHAGMFMASAGKRRMLVGDPKLGQQFASSSAQVLASLPQGPDFSAATQHLFDAVAAQCAANGYEVIRIPTVPARDGRTYLTYVNVLIDEQGGRRIVYLPQYRGVESMNSAACTIWEKLGFEVRPVDCTDVYRHFGCLHCLVNVLKR